MEHLLTPCQVPRQAEIWMLAKELWSMKETNVPWIEPTFGNILASPSVVYRAQNHGDSELGKSGMRLYQILMTESAHLIWKIRVQSDPE